MEYIQRPPSTNTDCIFCEAQTAQDGPRNLIIFRGRCAYVILNRYPYTSGHIMIVPNEHQPSLDLLNQDTRSEVMELANQSIQVLQAEYNPQGFNLGINIGEAAGAGVVGHIHLHVVPRWKGDTNFMSALGMTRVLPESLEDTYARLRQAWQKIALKLKP
jgi:ATP adenylyltransferase